VRTDSVGGGVRLTTASGSVDVGVEPDFVLAERLTGLARRRQLIEVVLTGEPEAGARCDGYGVVTATWHRLPRRRRIPLSAALALSMSGVPTHLRVEAAA
jgi:hypothetical protein